MKKVFLDCGTNLGQGFLQFLDKKIIDETFEIHCFEPNPHALEFSKKRFSEKKYEKYKINYHEVALWIEECTKVLTLESFDGEYYDQHTGQYLGSDLKSGGATNIMGDLWEKPQWIKDEWLFKDIEVNCINFSNFLKKNINENDYVICKMDIEGSEYEVLGKIIDDGTINLINEIYIEWHNHMLKENYNDQIFIDEMKKRNIKVVDWI